jgi:3-oxoacyl-[acyl-carrier protein] reductase
MRLRDRNVVVTGAAPGLGSAVARRAGGGSPSLCGGKRREHLEPLAALGIRTGAFDLSKPEGVAAAAEAVEKELGRVDGLAITAGGWAPGRLEETDEQVLDSMLSVNLRAHLWTVKSFLKLMRPGSAVVLVTSIWGPSRGPPGALAYIVSKTAAAALVETLAAELLERGIRVNGVAPGAMSREAEVAKLGRPPRRQNTSPTW